MEIMRASDVSQDIDKDVRKYIDEDARCGLLQARLFSIHVFVLSTYRSFKLQSILENSEGKRLY